jgi:CheY-like chemotaxis protein
MLASGYYAAGPDNKIHEMVHFKYILLVDDDEINTFISKRLLEKSGVADKIEVVSDGQQALNLLIANQEQRNMQPDLILLDINMPVMDGFTFLREVMKRFPEDSWNKKILMLSTSNNPKDKEEAARYPIIGYLTKPLSVGKLLSIFER